MIIKYEKSGKERKAFVKAVSEIIGEDAVYQGAPSFEYRVANWYTITRDGNLDVFDRADSREVENLIEQLAERGYIAADADTVEIDIVPSDEIDGVMFAVEMPRDEFTDAALENLRKLVDSKAGLIKKAFGANTLLIEVDEEAVAFPWFPDALPNNVQAYTHFITAICEMAKTQKRITAKERPVDNEKYAFRCFLLRLGFIGKEYKAERKILLKNFTGSSAFREVKANEISE